MLHYRADGDSTRCQCVIDECHILTQLLWIGFQFEKTVAVSLSVITVRDLSLDLLFSFSEKMFGH